MDAKREPLLQNPILRGTSLQWLRETRRTSFIVRLCAEHMEGADRAGSTWAAESLAVAEALDEARALVCARLGVSEDDEPPSDDGS